MWKFVPLHLMLLMGFIMSLKVIVPALAMRLGIGTWGHAAVEWLVPVKA